MTFKSGPRPKIRSMAAIAISVALVAGCARYNELSCSVGKVTGNPNPERCGENRVVTAHSGAGASEDNETKNTATPTTGSMADTPKKVPSMGGSGSTKKSTPSAPTLSKPGKKGSASGREMPRRTPIERKPPAYKPATQIPRILNPISPKSAQLKPNPPKPKLLVQWDSARSSKRARNEFTNNQPIYHIDISRDGGKLVFADDNNIRLLDLTADSEPKQIYDGLATTGLWISPSGLWVVAQTPKRALVWPAKASPRPQELHHEGRPVIAVAVSPTEELVATGDETGQIRIWNDFTGSKNAYRQHRLEKSDEIKRILFSQDGRKLLVATRTGKVHVLGVDFKNLHRYVLEPHVHLLAMASDASYFLTGNDAGTVRLWREGDATGAATLLDHIGPVPQIAISPDDERITAIDHTGRLTIWDSKGRRTGSKKTDIGEASILRFSPRIGRWLLVGAEQTGLVLLDTWHDGEPTPPENWARRPLLKLAGTPTSVAFSGNGSKLATADTSGTARVWNTWTISKPNLALLKQVPIYAEFLLKGENVGKRPGEDSDAYKERQNESAIRSYANAMDHVFGGLAHEVSRDANDTYTIELRPLAGKFPAPRIEIRKNFGADGARREAFGKELRNAVPAAVIEISPDFRDAAIKKSHITLADGRRFDSEGRETEISTPSRPEPRRPRMPPPPVVARPMPPRTSLRCRSSVRSRT